MKKLGAVLVFVLFSQGAFAALNLEQTIRIAKKGNPNVLASQKKYAAARSRLNQAAGAFLPTVKLDGTLSRSYSQPSTVQITMGGVPITSTFGTEDIASGKSVSLSLTQPVFAAGLFPGYSIALKDAENAKEDFRKALLEASYNAAAAYFGLLKAQKLVQLSNESLEMADEHLIQVQSLVKFGSGVKSDLLRAEMQKAKAELALTQAESGFELAKISFNGVLGRPLNTLVEVEEVETSVTIGLDLKSILDFAYKNRPDWKQFILTKKMAEDNVFLSRTAYLPTVMLSAQSDNRIAEYPSYLTDVRSWTIAGAASMTLFDGLRIQNKIKESEAALDAQKALEAGVKSAVELEVNEAYLSLNSALKGLLPAQKAQEFAAENYKISKLRYKVGAGTNLEAIDAQVALTRAKVDYYNALFDLEIAKAKIDKVIGAEGL